MSFNSRALFRIERRRILAWRQRGPMSDTRIYSSDVAFTPAVKAIQAKKGSRESYAEVSCGLQPDHALFTSRAAAPFTWISPSAPSSA